MKILVTGGTGVIEESVIRELLARGHQVVDAAAGCDAVLHIAGDTRDMLAEAAGAGVRRFVFVSPLGEDSSESEQLARRAELDWTIVRPGNVYGPGDEVISLLLKMVRALPAVPIVDSGDREFQPIWHEDLAKVLAAVIERNDLTRQVLDVPGPEITTMNDLLARFAEITGRKPLRVPVPSALAQLVAGHNKLTMLPEEHLRHDGGWLGLLGIDATPLDHGLRILADAMPETLPEEGVGSLEHKRFYADISGSRYSAAALMMFFRERVNDFMPLQFAAEPGVPEKIEKGVTLTGKLPLRGHFQVRVEVAEPRHVVLATIEGHPLAGIVEFTTTDTASGVRFAIDNYARASNFFDLVAVRTLGGPAQAANWRAVVQRVIDASGGTSDGVHQEKEILRGEEAARLEERVKRLVQERKQEESRENAP